MSEPMYTREQFLNSYITPAVSSPFISTECSICQEPYCDSTDGCAVTFSDKETCNHVFCRACITSWLSIKSVNTCALCRRVLFVLEPPAWIDDDDYYYDDDYDDDYDDYDSSEEQEDEDFDEEEYDEDSEDDEELEPLLNSESETGDLGTLPLRVYAADRNYILPQQLVLEILTSIWFKTWWLLECYRDHVFRRHNRSFDPSPWFPLQEKTSLPGTICLMHALFHTLDTLGIDYTHLYGGREVQVLLWLVQDIAACLKAHIDTTNGRDCIPNFPPWKQRIWGEPLQWLLASPTDFEYALIPIPLQDGVY